MSVKMLIISPIFFSDMEFEEDKKELKEDSGHNTPSVCSDDRSETSSPELPEIDEDHVCSICGDKYDHPRILSCLHVFCTNCLEKLVEDCNKDGIEADKDASSVASNMKIIRCTTCDQATRLSVNGVSSLPLDTVLMLLVNEDSGEDAVILCTSCKAQEKAEAQCSDCANFLCPGCVTAHQFMRCFENHRVRNYNLMSI